MSRLTRFFLASAGLFVLAGCSGTSPSSSTTLPTEGHVHAIRTTDSGELLLGLHGSLWRNYGTSWTRQALDGRDAMALGVAAADSPFLVGGHDVLARSSDGGITFEDLAPDDLPSLDIHALAQSPSEPTIAYAAVAGVGLFRSDDAGTSWVPASSGSPSLPVDITSIAVGREDPQVVLVGSGSSGIFWSEDGGETFELASPIRTLGLAIGPDGQVMAATERGVDISDDGLTDWRTAAALTEFAGQPVAVAIGNDGSRWVITEERRALYRADQDQPFVEVDRP